MPRVETRNEKLDLRLTPSAKRDLQIAAAATRRSVSEFILESALARSEETLPDRKRFGLDANGGQPSWRLWIRRPSLRLGSPNFSERILRLWTRSSQSLPHPRRVAEPTGWRIANLCYPRR